MDLTKLINGKSWNANPIIVHGKHIGTALRIKQVNFLNADKAWEEVDCRLSPQLTMDKAPFYVQFSKRSTGPAVMGVNNRFEVRTKKEITSPEFVQNMTCLGARTIGGSFSPINDVSGQLYDTNNNGRFDSVIYEDAFTQKFKGHLLFFSDHARVPKLRKHIIFETAPLSDVALSFRLGFSGITELSPANLKQGQTRDEENGKWASNLSSGQSLYLHSDDLENDSQYNKGLYVQAQGEPQRGCGIHKTFIWDSRKNPITGLPEPKIAAIESYIKLISVNEYELTKIIPESFFNGAVYPVIADTVTDFTPDPGSGGNGVDGRIQRDSADALWDTAHDAGNGTASSTVGVSIAAQVGLSGGFYGITRTFLVPDTFSLPDTDVISAAKWSLFTFALRSDDNDGNAFARVVVSSPASDNDLVLADYDQCGAINNPTPFSSDIRIENGTVGVYNDFDMLPAGIANINKTGVSPFGFREGHDCVDDAPGPTFNWWFIRSADQAGTLEDPIFSVTHAPPEGIPLFDHHYRQMRA